MSAASTSGDTWPFGRINRLARGAAGAGQAYGRKGGPRRAGRVAAFQRAAWGGFAGGLAGGRAAAGAGGDRSAVAVAV